MFFSVESLLVGFMLGFVFALFLVVWDEAFNTGGANGDRSHAA
jgi:hypothetical protein